MVYEFRLEKSDGCIFLSCLFLQEFTAICFLSKINFEIDFCMLKIQFVELDLQLDFSKIKSTDQGVRLTITYINDRYLMF